MVETVGKKLSQARIKRGLTVDEAAHATKLRPDKIVALENDDLSRFANNIYAKGFLQIYARFLNVDVAEFARTIDNSNPISVSDYQYLSNAPMPRRDAMPARQEERRPPSLAPLFLFAVLIALGLGGSWFYANYQRIIGDQATKHARSIEQEPKALKASNPETAAPATTPEAAPAPAKLSTQPPEPKPAPVIPPPAPSNTPAPVAAAPTPISDQDFITPTPVATGDAAGRPNASGVNEILVAAIKKTWVTVRKDDPKGVPIFEDYVYPRANPLKLKGARFFIEARDPTAVQITKNGLPFAYQPTGVPVQ